MLFPFFDGRTSDNSQLEAATVRESIGAGNQIENIETRPVSILHSLKYCDN